MTSTRRRTCPHSPAAPDPTQSPDERTLPLALWSFQGQYSINVPAIAASVVLTTLPILVLYAVGRRQLLSGLTAGFGSRFADMRIGIIGAGNIGGTLTRRLTDLGHDVTVANSRGPASLMLLTRETGARAGSVEEVVRSADLVVLAVPLKAVSELPADTFSGHVLVDACNFYPGRDGDPRAGKAAQRVVGVGGAPLPRRARRQGVQHHRVHALVRARHPARQRRTPRPARGGRQPGGEAAGDGADRRAGVRRR